VRLLTEGVHPVIRSTIWVRPLGCLLVRCAVYDEVSLELSRKAWVTWKEMGVLDNWGDGTITRDVIDTMVNEHSRGGRHHGGGFMNTRRMAAKRSGPN
jgi:3-hydroxyacyl-CoA dehydrogenase/enoyl-CoA hydratase/3-hydroxybutyryl-CoA epimerase